MPEGVPLLAVRASASSVVHGPGPMGVHPDGPEPRDCSQHLLDLRGPSLAHEREECRQERDDVGVAGMSPRPHFLLSDPIARGHGPHRGDLVSPSDDILVRHREDDAQGWAGRSIGVSSLGQVEAPLALKESC